MTTTRIPRYRINEIAGRHRVDPRTLRRAMRRGPEAVHGDALRERVMAALADLDISAPEAREP